MKSQFILYSNQRNAQMSVEWLSNVDLEAEPLKIDNAMSKMFKVQWLYLSCNQFVKLDNRF